MLTGAWPVAGREELVRGLRESLESVEGCGALLVGRGGIGKTALARRVLHDLKDQVTVVHIRGTPQSKRTPLGALNVLMSQVEPRIAENPLLVIAALEELLVRHGTKPVVVLVDNAEQLDDMSASVLSQLADRVPVKLLVICESLQRTPEEFSRLWQNGCLIRFEIPPLELDDVCRLLADALGSPVSGFAAHALWSASNGHPEYVQAMAVELVESGDLKRNEDGLWVMNGSQGTFGRKLAETVLARLRRYEPDCQTAVEILSLAGRVPVQFLAEVTGQRCIDTLHEEGLLVLDHTDPLLARPADRTIAIAVRSGLPLGRKRELLKCVLERMSPPPDEATLATLEYVAWRLDCGVSVPDEQLTRAAREANEIRDGAKALRFARMVPARRRTAALVLEQAHANVLLGDAAEAIRILDDAAGLPASSKEMVDLELLRAMLLKRDVLRHGEARQVLRAVQEQLDQQPDLPELVELRAAAALTDVEFLAFEGHLPEAERLAAGLAYPLNRLSETSHLRAAAWQAEATALMGHQEDGLARLRVVIARMRDAHVPQPVWEYAQGGVFNALIVAGHWPEAYQEIQHWRALHEVPHRYHGIEADLALGVMHALAGRGSAALESLVSVRSELNTPDSGHYRARIEAATAYARALQGQSDAARAHLELVDAAGGNPGWGELQVVTYFYWLATAELGDAERASKEMLRAADENAEKGAGAFELMHLTAAVMLGQTRQAERLSVTARAQQGALAGTAACYADALLHHDAGRLIDAVHLALDMDFSTLARSAARTAREWSATAGERERIRAVDRILARTDSTLSTAVVDPLQKLTESERRVAQLAAKGTASKEIAAILNLSVRTVDGHLNRTYAKLNLSGRAHLRSVLD